MAICSCLQVKCRADGQVWPEQVCGFLGFIPASLIGELAFSLKGPSQMSVFGVFSLGNSISPKTNPLISFWKRWIGSGVTCLLRLRRQHEWRGSGCSCYFFFYFNWSIVALQCCVSFCCRMKWISHMYTYIPSFLDFPPIWVTTEHWVSCVIQSVFFSYLNILYVVMYICQSQSIPPPPRYSLVSICFSVSVSALKIKIMPFSRFHIHVLCVLSHNPMDYSPPRLLCPWNFPGKNTGVDCCFLLQGIFLTRDRTCAFCVSCIGRRILYHCAS